ncbi:hypothetical protein N7510_006605 [Penicillium lagena]|uniref:uncharacterized protein n=1 Tax=Penicillium lagena TaxID=94218 RepID=UPI00253FE77D|nr:uncharacterized protein N7510_006605 [Penicillium lagena]KAJ5613411.1 hypothetical protein N7510_006605 [Penicillium lagena]
MLVNASIGGCRAVMRRRCVDVPIVRDMYQIRFINRNSADSAGEGAWKVTPNFNNGDGQSMNSNAADHQ